MGAPRPGYDISQLPEKLDADLMERVVLLKLPPFPITSTDIRRDVAAGRSPRYDTPTPVIEYIMKRGLYRPASVGEKEG